MTDVDATTDAYVQAFLASSPTFEGILREVRELSKKKPEATMSASKVKLVNRVLKDLQSFLKDQPSGKYLDLLDEEALPQMSDAVLAMVQFETAIEAFSHRYNRFFAPVKRKVWITSELVASTR